MASSQGAKKVQLTCAQLTWPCETLIPKKLRLKDERRNAFVIQCLSGPLHCLVPPAYLSLCTSWRRRLILFCTTASAEWAAAEKQMVDNRHRLVELLLYHCQLNTQEQPNRRNYLFWLMILDGLVHSHMAPWTGQGIMVMGACPGEVSCLVQPEEG